MATNIIKLNKDNPSPLTKKLFWVIFILVIAIFAFLFCSKILDGLEDIVGFSFFVCLALLVAAYPSSTSGKSAFPFPIVLTLLYLIADFALLIVTKFTDAFIYYAPHVYINSLIILGSLAVLIILYWTKNKDSISFSTRHKEITSIISLIFIFLTFGLEIINYFWPMSLGSHIKYSEIRPWLFTITGMIWYLTIIITNHGADDRRLTPKNTFCNIARGNWLLIILILITGAGFLIRLIFALKGNIDFDEGIHLYDAKSVLDGLIPFRDYFTREPYYIYSLSFFVKIIGPKLIASRLLSVLTGTATIPIIYLLGKKVFSKNIGLVAASIFALSPFVIFQTHLGNLYGVYPFIMSLAFLSFAYLIKKFNITNAILCGFIFGTSVHFYRLSIFYLPVLGFLIGFSLIKKSTWKSLISFLTSLTIPLAVPLVIFSMLAGFRNLEIIYGTKELIIGYFSTYITLVIGHLARFLWQKFSSKRSLIFSIIISIIIIAFVISFFTIGITADKKAKILFEAIFQSWHIVFFILFAFLLYLRTRLIINKRLSFIISFAIIATIFLTVYTGVYSAEGLKNFGCWVISHKLETFTFFTIALSMILFSLIKPSKYNYELKAQPWWGWWLIFVTPAAFYLIHVQISTSIFLSFIIMGCIIAAHGIVAFKRSFWASEQYIKVPLAIIFCTLILLPPFVYLKIPLRDRFLPQVARQEIETFIKTHTQEKEEIFTNLSLLLLETNRKMVLDISRPTIYAVNPVEMPSYIGVSKNLIPSGDLASYIKNNVRLIILDSRTKVIFETNPDFQNILKDYHLTSQWPKYEIEAWEKLNSN